MKMQLLKLTGPEEFKNDYAGNITFSKLGIFNTHLFGDSNQHMKHWF